MKKLFKINMYVLILIILFTVGSKSYAAVTTSVNPDKYQLDFSYTGSSDEASNAIKHQLAGSYWNLYDYNQLGANIKLPLLTKFGGLADIGDRFAEGLWYYVIENKSSSSKAVTITAIGASNVVEGTNLKKSSKVVATDTIPANTTRMYLYTCFTSADSCEVVEVASIDIVLNADNTLASTPTNIQPLIAVAPNNASSSTYGGEKIRAYHFDNFYGTDVDRGDRKALEHWYQFISSSKVIQKETWVLSEEKDPTKTTAQRNILFDIKDPWTNSESYKLTNDSDSSSGPYYIVNSALTNVSTSFRTEQKTVLYKESNGATTASSKLAGYRLGDCTLTYEKNPGYVTLDKTSQSITYGTSSATFNISSSHGGTITQVQSTSVSGVSVSRSGNTVTVSGLGRLNAGTTVKIKVTCGGANGYTDAEAEHTITIVKAPAKNPTLTSVTATYDGKEHYVTSSGGSGGTIYYSKSTDEGTTWSEWSTSNWPRVSAGITHIKAYVKGDANHTDTSATSSATITINKAPSTNPTLTSVTATYDGKGHNVTVSGGSGGTIYYSKSTDGGKTWSEWSTSNWTRVSAGTTYIKAYVKGDANHNDTSATSNATITINKVTPTITLSPTSGSVNYNATASFTATTKSSVSTAGTLKATSGATSYVTISSGASTSITATSSGVATTIGYKGETATTTSRTITVTFTPTDTTNFNTATATYSVTTVNKIPAQNPTLTSVTATYDGKEHYVTSSGGSGGTIYYSKSTDEGKTWSEWSTSNWPRVSAGITHIKAYVKGDSNHSDTSATSSATITINKATPTLTPNKTSTNIIAKNSETIGYTYTGNGTVTVSTSSSSIATATVNTTNKTVTITGVAAGTATITINADATANYNAKSATISVTVGAANYSVGTTYYTTLATAYASITGASGTITVKNSNTDNTAVTIANNKNVVLDLAGKTITVNGIASGAFITNNGQLTLKDDVGNGKIERSYTNPTSSMELIRNIGTLDVKSGTYNLMGVLKAKSVTLYNEGTLNIDGGIVKLKANSGSESLLYSVRSKTGTVNQNGGEIEATTTVNDLYIFGIANTGDGKADLKVKGGKITIDSTNGASYAVALTNYDGGNKESTIEITGSPILEASGKWSRTVCNVNGSSDVIIRSGTIRAESTTSAIGVYNNSSNTEIGTPGGSVSTEIPMIESDHQGVQADNYNIEFYDGILKGKTTAYSGTVIPETGYGVSKTHDGTYDIATLTVKNYKVGNYYYKTLLAAYNAITGTSGTITVESTFADNTAVTIAETKNIVLDLQGNTITVNGIAKGAFITNKGTFEVKDSKGNGKIDFTNNATTGSTYIFWNDSGTLNIRSGTYNITASANYPAVIITYGSSTKGIVNVYGGTLTCTNNGTGWSAGISAKSGTINISGGKVSAKSTSMTSVYGIINNGESNSYINVTGGEIYSDAIGIDYAQHNSSFTGNQSTIQVSGTAKITGKSRAIRNSFSVGNIAILGGTISSDTNEAITITSGGSIQVSGGTINGKTSAIGKSGSGNIEITGGTLTSTEEATVYHGGSGNIIVKAGTITGTNKEGVKHFGTGSLTIGDSSNAINNSTPTIKANTYGVHASSFSFYDGSITAQDSIYCSVKNVTTPTGYGVSYAYSDGNEIATLAVANYQLNSNGGSYATLKDAYAQATNGDTIFVTANIVTDESDFRVNTDKAITINLKGKTINKTTSRITNNGTLKIIDTEATPGKLRTIADSPIQSLIFNSGVLTIENGEIYNVGMPTGNWYTILNDSTGDEEVYINGGSVYATLSDSITSTTGNPSVIYSRTGKVTVSGGIVRNYVTKVSGYGINSYIAYNSAGQIKVEGGTVKCSNGSAIYIAAGENYTNTTTVEITGGEVIGSTYGIYTTLRATGEVKVKGGTVTGGTTGIVCNTAKKLTIGDGINPVSKESPKINGNTYGVQAGEFSFYDGVITAQDSISCSIKNVTTPEAYGISYSQSGDMEIATLEASKYQLSSNGGIYATLEDAYSHAIDGDTILVIGEMVNDPSNLVVTADKAITINLQGNIINKTTSRITNNGTLKIIDTEATPGKLRTIADSPIQSLIFNSGVLTIENGEIYNVGMPTGNWYAILNDSNGDEEVYIKGGSVYATLSDSITSTTGNPSVIYSRTGKVTVSGGIVRNYVTKVSGYGILSNISYNGGGQIKVTGGTVKCSNGSAIYVSAGEGYTNSTTIEITGGEIEGSTYGTYTTLRSPGKVTITGGSVKGNTTGVACNTNNTLVIGKDDGTVSVESPVIQGNENGILVVSGTQVEFYDGILKSITQPYSKKPTKTPTGYGVFDGTETIGTTVYKTAYLKKEATLGVTPSTLNIGIGDRATVTVNYNGDGTLDINSTDIATATLSGNTITITGLKLGTTKLTLVASAGTQYLGGTAEINVTVEQRNLSNTSEISASLSNTTFEYTSKEIKPTATVIDKVRNVTLTEDVDYSITYSGDKVNVGTARAKIVGAGNYTGSIELNYQITKKQISFVWENTASFVYDGMPHPNKPTVVSGVEGETILYTHTTQTNASDGVYTSKVTVTGVQGGQGKTENYEFNNTTKKYTIAKSAITVKANDATKKYDGNPLTCNEYTLTSGTLVAGHHIEAEIVGSQTNIGSSTNELVDVLIKTESGEDKTANYNIEKVNGRLSINDLEDELVIEVKDTDEYEYTGSAIKPKVLAKLKELGTTLVENTDYTLSYENNVNVGIATIIVKGINNYQNIEGTVNFTIIPRKIVIKPIDIRKVYTGEEVVAEGIELVEGKLVSGHSISGVLDTNPKPVVDVGVYEVNISSYSITPEDVARNYEVEPLTGRIEVTPAEMEGSVIIKGTNRVGETLTAEVTIDPTPENITYKWYTSAVEGGEKTLITRTSGDTLELWDVEYNKYIHVEAIGTKANYKEIVLEDVTDDSNNNSAKVEANYEPVIRIGSDDDIILGNSTIAQRRSEISKIVIKDKKIKPEGNIIAEWDASYLKNKSVIAWLVQTETGLYELHIGGWGKIGTRDLSYMFANYTNCTTFEGLPNLHTENVTKMEGMFKNCKKLESIDLSGMSTINVMYMQDMFNGCSSLTSLNLDTFNTSSVTYISGIFENCSSLTSLNLKNFSLGNVSVTSRMFYGCESLDNIDVSGFNTPYVYDMSEMFKGCSNITSLDLRNLDTENVMNMSGMFEGCTKLSKLDLVRFNTNSVTDMSNMFKGCTALESVDVTSFDTSVVKNMSSMFEKCNSLTSLNLVNFDTNSLTECDSMFKDNISLRTMLLGENFGKLTGANMFTGCNALLAILTQKATAIELGANTGLNSLTNAKMYVNNETDRTNYLSATNYSIVFGEGRVKVIMELLGDNPVTLNPGETYTDDGVLVIGLTKDDVKEYVQYGYILETIGLPVDTTTPGNKQVIYRLKFGKKGENVVPITSIEFYKDRAVVRYLGGGSYASNIVLAYVNSDATEKLVLTSSNPNVTLYEVENVEGLRKIEMQFDEDFDNQDFVITVSNQDGTISATCQVTIMGMD